MSFRCVGRQVSDSSKESFSEALMKTFPMEFEEILKRVGDFDKFQKCLIFLFLIPVSALTVIYDRIFMWTTPDHWCRVPELTNLSSDLQKLYISPQTIEQGLASHEKCLMFDKDYTTFDSQLTTNASVPAFNRSTVKCRDGWTFDWSVLEETAVTKVSMSQTLKSQLYWCCFQFELVCDRAHYVSLIMSIGPIATMTMNPIFSFITDR